MQKKRGKALVLLSGGLDSRLALMMMKGEPGIKEVIALHFLLPFGEGCSGDRVGISDFAQQQKVKLRFVDCTKGRLLNQYMELLKSPQFGRGTALNPCIDCRIFILKETKKIAKNIGADFIVTGEVVGERPMSQNKRALQLIERKANLKNKILRPLSAKGLPETEAETKGFVDRDRMERIDGRQRRRQMELAMAFKISYPNPAGGCLLCEREFCKKITPLLKLSRRFCAFDIALTKLGRHFEEGNIVLGKNLNENKRLEALAKKDKKGLIIIPAQPGPTAFIRNKSYQEKAQELIKKYSKYRITSFETISTGRQKESLKDPLFDKEKIKG